MKTETPAKGILRTGAWPDAESYYVACECTDPDHAANMWIEVKPDQQVKQVTVGFYVQTQTPFWSMTRWRAIWNMLRYGYHQGEHHLILNQQSALNLAETVKTSVTKLAGKDRSKQS